MSAPGKHITICKSDLLLTQAVGLPFINSYFTSRGCPWAKISFWGKNQVFLYTFPKMQNVLPACIHCYSDWMLLLLKIHFCSCLLHWRKENVPCFWMKHKKRKVNRKPKLLLILISSPSVWTVNDSVITGFWWSK